MGLSSGVDETTSILECNGLCDKATAKAVLMAQRYFFRGVLMLNCSGSTVITINYDIIVNKITIKKGQQMPIEPDAKTYQALVNTMKQTDPHSLGVRNMIESVYPALATKLFKSTKTIMKLVMTGLNPMDVLDYPICSKCEGLAWLDGKARRGKKWVDVCQCDCGRRTIDPPTFREWIREELKRKAPPDFMEEVAYVTDGIAMRMMRKAMIQFHNEAEAKSATRSGQMGIVMPDGSTHVPEKNVVKLDEDVAVRRLAELNMIEAEDDDDV
jgi:hypothetical protein